MAWWDAVLSDISAFLGGLGLDVSPSVLWVVLLVVAAAVLFQFVQSVFGALDGVVDSIRTQLRERPWRDAGRLSTFVSLVLLVLAYGLFPSGQSLAPSEQAQHLVGDFVGSIAPAAILTQALVLGVSWLVLGGLAGVGRHELAEPFTTALAGSAMFAVLFLLSVVPFAATGGDTDALGSAALVLFSVLIVVVPGLVWAAQRGARRRGAGTATASVADSAGTGSAGTSSMARSDSDRARAAWAATAGFGALVLLAAMIALPTAWIYAEVASDPSVGGLIGVDLAIASVVFLIVCFMFRSYLAGVAGAPPVVGHLIDLCLAVSASAIALTGSPALEVALGTVPAIVVGALPGLVVATMIAVTYLRQPQSPRLAVSVAAAVALGLLVALLREIVSVLDLASWLPLG